MVDELLWALQDVTGYEVAEDIYEGDNDKYIVYTYEDERPALYGDNAVLHDTVYIQLGLFTPQSYNYKTDKKKIRKYLESVGFRVVSIQSWLEDVIVNTERVRHTTFSCNIMINREDD